MHSSIETEVPCAKENLKMILNFVEFENIIKEIKVTIDHEMTLNFNRMAKEIPYKFH